MIVEPCTLDLELMAVTGHPAFRTNGWHSRKNDLLLRRFVKGQTYDEIAREYGLSLGRIRDLIDHGCRLVEEWRADQGHQQLELTEGRPRLAEMVDLSRGIERIWDPRLS